MLGKPSVSEVPAWTTLRVVEEGGFIGLHRGATIVAAQLSTVEREQFDRLIVEVRACSPTEHFYPDMQSLRVEVEGPEGQWQARFDTAELPPSVSTLRKAIKLVPLPYE